MALTTQSRPRHHGGRFTFEALHRGTLEMSGTARAEAFYRLPKAMQAEAWRCLAEQVERDRSLEIEAPPP
jgi:hypothetical protein